MDDKFKYRFDILDEKIDKLVDLSEKQTTKLHGHDIKLAEYNALLDKHIEGVIQNRDAIREVKTELHSHQTESHESHEKLRLDVEPLLVQKKAHKYIKNLIVGIGGLAGAAWTILKLMGKI